MYKKPTPEKLSEETWNWELIHLIQIPNTGFYPDLVRKRMGLIGLGLSEKEAEEMCKPKEMDVEKMMDDVMEMQRKELRNLAKLNPKRKKQPKPNKLGDDVTEIQISAVDLSKDKKWMATVGSESSRP
jgi:hypothetical protein